MFDRFLPWVWATIVVLFATGYYLVFELYDGFAIAGQPVMIMHAIAWVMVVACPPRRRRWKASAVSLRSTYRSA